MGYGISFENKGGRNFYEKSYQLGDEEHNYGFVAVGGRKNKDTVCLHFTGEGLIAAKDGWESRLYEFLTERAKQPRISRCDVAHDFLNGEYTCEQALKDWEDGGYTLHRSKPISECVGGDWKLYKGTGKTFYVGSRKNASSSGGGSSGGSLEIVDIPGQKPPKKDSSGGGSSGGSSDGIGPVGGWLGDKKAEEQSKQKAREEKEKQEKEKEKKKGGGNVPDPSAPPGNTGGSYEGYPFGKKDLESAKRLMAALKAHQKRWADKWTDIANQANQIWLMN